MRLPLVLALTTLAAGPQADPVGPQEAVPAAEAAAPATSPDGLTFESYLGQVRAKAQAAGVSTATLDRELGGLSPNMRVVQLDRAQPDDSNRVRPSFRDYLAGHVDSVRATRGQANATRLQPQIAEIERSYGVPGPMVLALWGIETSYGGFTGNFDLIRSFATLAWDGRRRALFERELITSLKLIDSGAVTRDRLTGSWAGATGMPQFLPSSFLRYGVDGDGDGRPDIWRSEADTLASIANYLRDNGWVDGREWGTPVYVPPAVERWRLRSITPARSCRRPLDAHSRWLSVGEWKALGLVPLGHRWPADDVLATLIEPDGEGQGAYLTYGNYRALLAYNCSNFYALSAGLLADRIAEAAAAPPPAPAPAAPPGSAAGGLR